MFTLSFRSLIWTFGVAVLVFIPVPALRAQEVQWRYDYPSAKDEAKKKNRPLMLDMVKAGCVWCQRLETSTFRDPGIVALLNEQFIPIKVDGRQETWLSEALQIRTYPTLVLATPDGDIVEFQQGFVDAARFARQLERALHQSAPATKAQAASPVTTTSADDAAKRSP